MNTRLHPLPCRGYSLIECIVYLGVLAVLFTLAATASFHFQNNHRLLTRVSRDLVQALQAGERWREDVRASTRPPRVELQTDGSAVLLIASNGPLRYVFTSNAVWRIRGDGPGEPVLRRVRHSRMTPGPQKLVPAWRWEVELEPVRPTARTQPRFTFQAVAGGSR